MKQKVFSKNAVDALRVALNSEDGLRKYLSEGEPFASYESMNSTIEVDEEAPILAGIVDADYDDAVKLYEYLGPMSRMHASDERLWAYLSHVTFLDYCRARWPLVTDVTTEDGRKKAKGIIIEHWFTSTDNRTLRRHGVARLWWPVHLTVAPWERDPAEFSGLERENRYWLSKVLLGPGRQDLYQAVLERGLGRSEIVLIALLSFIDSTPAAQTREAWRAITMEVNLMLSYRKLMSLHFVEAQEIILQIFQGISESLTQE